MAITHILRPYQAEIGRAVLDSVLNRRGLTFTVEIARQGGKNELSAQLELFLLTLFMAAGGNLVKAAPTFDPQVLISLARLKERLSEAGLGGLCRPEAGHILRLGQARQVFLSAQPHSQVVGNTAHILLELDEAQEVEREKFYKEFRPMGASSNVTTVLYGTPWDGTSLLEEAAQSNRELEHQDGVRRHFQFDWQEVARHNLLYLQYVEGERQRLGESHPLFRTQYLLLPVAGADGLFSVEAKAQLQGQHLRQRAPQSPGVYVAGIDVAGESPGALDAQARALQPRRDSTVVTIGRLDFSACDALNPQPRVEVVEHYWWTGRPQAGLYAQLVDLLRHVWRCRRVVVDATGLGAGLASFLTQALGKGVLTAFQFTAASKSRLGYDLLAAVNTGRLKIYAPDGSPEYQEFWRQMELARAQYRPSGTFNFLVDPQQGHDDFLASLALLVKAAEYLPRSARGRLPEA